MATPAAKIRPVVVRIVIPLAAVALKTARDALVATPNSTSSCNSRRCT